MYRVKYHKQVIKFLQKQDKKIVKQIIDFFDVIKIDLNFRNYDVKQLKGIENNELLIEVIKADSRGDIYK